MEEKKSARSKRKSVAVEPDAAAPDLPTETPLKKAAAKKSAPTAESPAPKKTRVAKKSVAAIETTDADELTVAAAAPVEPTEAAAPVNSESLKKVIAKKAVKSASEKTAAKKSSVKAQKAEAADETPAPDQAPKSNKAVKPKRKPAVRKTKAAPIEAVKSDNTKESDANEIQAVTPNAENISALATETTVTEADENESIAAPKAEYSDVFKQLAEPQLPVLAPENRARLQIQSPGRIFLYWSLKNNPYETLHRAFGDRAAGYILVVKLKNLSADDAKLFPIESEGSWWFDADANTTYQAEIGFYSESRPFIRLLFSNTAHTPRSAPSPNTDWSMDFIVTADQFAEVLDAAGYAQDAFDVAIAGDDPAASDEATRTTFAQVAETRAERSEPSELRYALFMLASGVALETLRGQIGESLYAILEMALRKDAEKLSAENIHLALKENFVFEGEGDEFATPVYGASSINFPKKSKRPKFSPISSFR